MKKTIIVVLVVLGLYWLVDHAAPLPLNHESFGLYEHNIHRIIGIVCLAAAALVAWYWKSKKMPENF